MPPLDESRAAVVRAWVERVLSGYWTHAGYLNWDTGLGFKRWHQGKKLGLSQAALLGIAVCPELTPRGPWAKWMFDRSLELFERWVDRAHGHAAGERLRRALDRRRRAVRGARRRRACRPTRPRRRCSG